MDCNFDELCRMTTDHEYAGDFSILTDGFVVCIHEQAAGSKSVQELNIPRNIFNRLVRWYARPQKFIRP